MKIAVSRLLSGARASIQGEAEGGVIPKVRSERQRNGKERWLGYKKICLAISRFILLKSGLKTSDRAIESQE